MPSGSKLQMYDLDEDHRGVQVIDIKPRNYISNASVENLPQSEVVAHAFTPDR